MKNEHKWKLIEAVAADHGIRPGTLRQWKLRGVPFWMHLTIVQSTFGKVSAKDLMDTRPQPDMKKSA